jgi:membrane protein implicated in regulation of membrane protease activity
MMIFSWFAAIFPLNTLGHYLHWHIFLISVANLIVIILMIVVFVVALFAPFPGRRRRKQDQ